MRLSALIATLAFSLAGLAMADESHASIRMRTDIPPQPLGAALQTLAKDRGFQLVYESAEINPVRTKGAAGELTSEEALTQLLSGTGFTYKFYDDNAVSILPVNAKARHQARAESSSSDTPRGQKATDPFRLAEENSGAAATDSSVEKNNNSEPASQNNPVQLEEVLVTAQKRTEKLIDVPISVFVLSSDELDKRHIMNMEDLSTSVPGLSFNNDVTNHKLQIRGVSNPGWGNTATVGTYIDEADTTVVGAFTPNLPVFDLQQIEVLRGPQGTLFGDGAVGGVVRFITNNPTFDGFYFGGSATGKVTLHGAPSEEVRGTVNIPLADDLAVRIAGQLQNEGGWIDAPNAGETNVNHRNNGDVRLKVRWQPLQALVVSGLVQLDQSSGGISNQEDPVGQYIPANMLTSTQELDEHSALYSLTVAYTAPFAEITNVTTSFAEKWSTFNQTSLYPASPPPAPALGSIGPSEYLWNRADSDELRASSVGNGPWKWTLGTVFREGRYSYLGVTNSAPVDQPITGAPIVYFGHNYNVGNQRSVFGDTNYQFFGSLTVGTGLRYFEDQFIAGYTGCCTYSATHNPLPQPKFHSLDPRFYADYKLDRNVNIYASVAKGFRSGGPNAFGFPTFGPESVLDYEVGTKGAFFDNKLDANVSVYYIDYKDYQITEEKFIASEGASFGIVSNAGAAAIKGIEWDLTWRPVERWEAQLSGNYLSGHFSHLDPGVTSVRVGDALNDVPDHLVTVSLQRDLMFGDHPGYLRTEYTNRGKASYIDRSVYPPPAVFQGQSDSQNLLGLSVGVEWTKQTSLELFASNLLNDRGYTTPLAFEGLSSRTTPLTVGVTLSYKPK